MTRETVEWLTLICAALAAVVPVGIEAVKWGRARYFASLHIGYLPRPFGSQPVASDLLDRIDLKAGMTHQIQLYITCRQTWRFEWINVAYVERNWATLALKVRRAPRLAVEISRATDWHVDNNSSRVSYQRHEADAEGGYTIRYAGEEVRGPGSPLCLTVQINARAQWDGLISVRDEQTHKTGRLPMRIS
jgi:hypothetical protein